MEHKDFGKGLMKKCLISPDAFIQMGLQLAHYRVRINRKYVAKAVTCKGFFYSTCSLIIVIDYNYTLATCTSTFLNKLCIIIVIESTSKGNHLFCLVPVWVVQKCDCLCVGVFHNSNSFLLH